jgi:hypothetical protein
LAECFWRDDRRTAYRRMAAVRLSLAPARWLCLGLFFWRSLVFDSVSAEKWVRSAKKFCAHLGLSPRGRERTGCRVHSYNVNGDRKNRLM